MVYLSCYVAVLCKNCKNCNRRDDYDLKPLKCDICNNTKYLVIKCSQSDICLRKMIVCQFSVAKLLVNGSPLHSYSRKNGLIINYSIDILYLRSLAIAMITIYENILNDYKKSKDVMFILLEKMNDKMNYIYAKINSRKKLDNNVFLIQ